MSTGAAERELLSTAAGSKVVLEPHHQYQADGPNSDGQDTTVQGLDAAAAHGVVERTPSSSPNSSHANTLPVHMSSSSSPPLQPGKGRVSGSPSAHQPQFEGGTQQSQQLQGQGSGLFQHKQPTATGDRQQSSPAASLPAAQSFQRGMQQLSATFEGPETGDDVYDAEEGSPQSEVGLELLGAMAAEIDSDKWEPAPGPVNPRSASAAAAAAAAGAQAAMAMLQARSEGAAGGQAGSFGSQPKSKAKSSNSAGAAANMSLVCQVPDCGVPLTGAHVSNYFRRHRVCVAHAKADVVSMHGKNYRFCQQCGVLHPIEDFDGQRKSCRVQLDKHNLRRRCRRKSHTYTKSSNSSYEQARGMGGMAMDPYGSFAQAYGMHPNMAWGAGMQAAAPKRGNAGWGRGVSEDTREMSRDRDEASNWMGDAADSAQHGGYMHAWGIGPGVPYDGNGVYTAGMAAGAASLPPMMQQQQGAAMQGGAVGQDGWGMGAGGASAAAAAAGANGWTDGWAQAGASGPAAAAAAAGGYGAGDASYAAALAAAAAAANDYHPSGAAGAAAAAVGKGSRAKQEQPSTRPAQQRQGSNNPAGGALDPAAAAAMYMPESHSGELLDQAAPAAAAAAGLSPGNAATAAPGVRKHLVSSGGGSSNTSGSNGMDLQQLRLYIAAAIAAGKGPGLTGLRDLGFVQQLLIVDELAHGVLAEMQREQDSPQQQQQQATHLPEPTVHLATAGSAATPAASAPAAAPVAAVPVNPSRHSNSSVLSQEQQQQRLKGQLTYHQLPQQQHQQKASAPKMPSPQQQQQQAAKSSSPQKQDRQRSAAAAAGSGAGAAVAAAAGPGGVQLLPTNVPPAALAALMEQIAKYGAKPAAAAAAAAAPGSESAAAAVAAAAARQPGSNSQDVRGVKREPSSGSLAPAQKRPRSAEPSQHLAAQGGNSNTQDLRQPGNTAAGGGGSNGGGYGGSNGGSNGAVRASPSSGASQQQQPPAGLCPPPSQQQQHRSSSPGVMQQLQQQLQGQLNSQGGGSVQVAQMLTQLLQQLTSGNGKAASPAPQQ